ncbi:uncharacterized protein [Anabrus simplex]|uniref:uncharacterized protein isoform X2 n=1 Tax=Anabrus simplex TaxID=316456 RepID=UPI0034DD0677
MTDLLIQSVTSRGDTFPRALLDGCRPSVVARYSRSGESLGVELKHSKSDDLVLQSSSIITPDIQHVRCDSPIPKTGCVVYEDDLVSKHVFPKAKYFSDSEAEVDIKPSSLDRTGRKISGEYSTDLQRTPSRHVGLYDQVDPEDSIRDMITENDFYRFVLFKRHYDKYLQLSRKYEEARNIAYYLEEKYHEIKAERDGLSAARLELERKLETRELELHEKEEELFLQLEKVVRLEEDCEKLRAEKEKFAKWKDKLEKEKNEAYRQLKRQAAESEATRRGLERARQEVMRQMTAIASEKDSLEKENERLKETLSEERKGVDHYLVDLSHQKKRISQNMMGLEKEVTELKFIARQSASLNNQFKKGMKHLASCKRKKCSVCVYTKATFGEYADRNDKKLLSCFQAPLQDLRNWIRPVPLSSSCSEDEATSFQKEREGGISSMSGYSTFLGHSSPLPSTRSEYSFQRAYSSETQTSASSPSPTPSLPEGAIGPLNYISYIDEVSTSSESSSDSGHGEEPYNPLEGPSCTCPYGNLSVPTDTSLTSSSSVPPAARAFSSDSGFSSELYDTGRRSLRSNVNRALPSSKEVEEDKPPPVLQRSRWTASFRKLINRVSKR